MTNISNYLEEALLNHIFRNQASPGTAVVYCGIVSDVAVDADMEAGTLTDEITGYTGDRKAITFGAPAQVTDKATIKNSAALDFLLMPAPAGRQVKYAIVCDLATVGEILYWCPLTVPKTWNEGDTFQIPIDNLVLDLA